MVIKMNLVKMLHRALGDDFIWLACIIHAHNSFIYLLCLEIFFGLRMVMLLWF